MHVELIYDLDCPNTEKARRNLREAFALAGREPHWIEWTRNAPECPAYVKGYGSPTILVRGKDVDGDGSGDVGSCCRLYPDGTGRFEGAPTVERILEALRVREDLRGEGGSPSSGWRTSLAAVPGIVLALLPNLACPACWPAYAGLLGSLGLGFLLDTAWLLPLTVACLLLAICALAYRARTRRGYGPFALGSVAALFVLAGKFYFGSDSAMYGGIGLLVAASAWNAWPFRRESAGCPACVSNTPRIF